MTKSKSAFLNMRKKENFYKKAKKIKVRARSYFKLQQLNRKFDLIKNDMNILDLGCSPGAWIEYIEKKLNDKNYNVVGIDLLEIQKESEFSNKVKFICDDFENLEDYLEKDFKFDLILSDIAPEFSGNQNLDRGRVHKINLKVIDLSKKLLKKNKNLVFKTFDGEDLDFVVKVAKKNFREIRFFKPKSSQKINSEIFIVCFKRI